MGRERVRAARVSRSRSTMSFQVQPAPRMAKAPTKNRMRCQRLTWLPAWMAASPTDHQHGISRKPGPDRAVETSQLQIRARPRGGEAVDPVSSRIGDATRAAGHRASGLPDSVSKVPWPFLVELVSGTTGVVPRASLRLGPLGRGPWAATSQICLLVCEALLCPDLTCWSTSGGTPQVVL